MEEQARREPQPARRVNAGGDRETATSAGERRLRARRHGLEEEKVHEPLRFEPYLRPMVWGGRSLGDALGKPLASEQSYGESWEITDHTLHRSLAVTGAWQGRTLRELMEMERLGLLGPAAARFTHFPWLIKFLDACDWLSVQVHPDDEAVTTLWPGERGKTEAWFVLSAEPKSRIYAGLKRGVTADDLRKALEDGSVVKCLHAVKPQAGDCFFYPAGTVHAVGGGVLMAEVQQTSDATFRLFDWNRVDAEGKSRTLHIDQALACIDWERGPVAPIKVKEFAGSSTKTVKQPLVDCQYFKLDYVQSTRPITLGDTGELQAVIALAGTGAWAGGENIETGQTWILPAASKAIECQPEGVLKLLVCTL